MKSELIEWGSRCTVITAIIMFCFASSESHLESLELFDNVHLNTTISYGFGFTAGIRDFVVENVKCVIYLIEHPVASMEEMVKAAVHYDETFISIKDYIARLIAKYPDMSIAEKGWLHARLIGDSFYMLGWVTIPTLSIGKFESLSRLVEKSGKRARDVATTISKQTAKVWPQSMSLQQPIGFAEWFAYEGQPASR